MTTETTIDTTTNAAPIEPKGAPPDRLAAAAAAAKEALRKEGVETEETGSAPATTEGEAKPAPETAAPAKDPVRAAVELRARQSAQRMREQAAAEASRVRAEAQRELEEARALKAKYEPVAGTLEKLRRKPNEAIRELGLHTKEFFDAAVEEAGQDADPIKVLERKYSTLEKKIADREAELAERETAAKHRETQERDRAMVEGYIAHVNANAEKLPMLLKRYGDDTEGLIWESKRVADRYYTSDYYKQTGQRITPADIAEFLEGQERERYGQPAGGQETGSSREVAPPGTRANSTGTHRSLSTATTTQRATVVDLKKLTPDQRREAAAQAGAKAVREYGKGAAGND